MSKNQRELQRAIRKESRRIDALNRILERQPIQAPDEQAGPVYVELDILNEYGIADPTPKQAVHHVIRPFDAIV